MKIHILAMPILVFGLVAPAIAANPACERKEVEIKRQIQHAEQDKKTYRVRGLEKALSQVQTHCSDAGLIKDKRNDIADQQQDIDKILEKIKENESEGSYDKVKKLERKLTHEREDLETLKQELKELES